MDDYYAYLSHERSHSPSLLDVPVESHIAGKFDSAHAINERLVQVELHPVSATAANVFALQYDRKIGQDDQQTESASSEDGYNIMDEEISSEVHSSCNSPVPSESASAALDWISAQTTAGSTLLPLVQSPQEVRGMMMMNDGHFDVTSGYASNNSSKDEAHSIDSCSSAASLRSASPDSLSSLGILPTTDGATPKSTDYQSVQQTAIATPSAPSSKETPIERDIRLAAMRENELRQQQSMGNIKLSDEKDRMLTPKKIVKPHPVNVDEQINYSNTQRVLATTRLQQEIDEQKRREMDLKRDGRVQSISEDRMDNDSAFDDEESVATQLSTSSSGTTIDPALHKATIKEQRAFFEKVSLRLSTSNDNLANLSAAAHPLKLQDKISGPKKGLPTPTQTKIPTFSPSSSMKMPLSMERFISSRGKVTINKMTGSVTSTPAHTAFSNGINHDSYVDFSAVRLHKVDHTNLPASTIKVYRSAKTKISQELREMEEREAELRRTRLSLGLSDDFATSDTLPSIKDASNVKESKVCSSVDLTSPAGHDLMEASQIPKGRQSLLLAQWEARSQQ